MSIRKPAQIHGLLVIDKPQGWTSRDVVNKVGRLLGEKRLGHAGTLDPMATGVLLVALGEATKGVRWWMAAAKSYETTVELGRSTLSDDAESAPLLELPVPELTLDMVQSALPQPGELLQVPPAVSALQRDGVRDHERVRRGEIVEREPRPVRLDAAEVLELKTKQLRLRLTCGAGFYVRSLGRDLGVALGTVAHLSQLQRTSAGGFTIHDALTMEQLAEMTLEQRIAHVLPVEQALARVLAVVQADDETVLMLRQGKTPVIQWVEWHAQPREPERNPAHPWRGLREFPDFSATLHTSLQNPVLAELADPLPDSQTGPHFPPEILVLDPAGKSVCVARAEVVDDACRLTVERGFHWAFSQDEAENARNTH